MTIRSVVLPSVALVLSLAFATAARADGTEALAPESHGVQFEPGTPAFADVLAKAKAAGKPVFIDFSTVWCGWCKVLDEKTFSQASVAEVMTGFVNVHVDSEKGEGIELSKQFSVRSWPQLVVVDANGQEIDRIVGYLPPEKFTPEVKRILAGEGTIPALRAAAEASPDDVDAGIAYGAKLARSKPTEAADLFSGLVSRAKDSATQGKVRLEYAAALLAGGKRDEAMTQAETLVRDLVDTPSAASAASRLGRAFLAADAKRALAFLDAARPLAKDAGDRAMVEQFAVAVHQRGIAESLKRQAEAAGDDPQALNAVAWTCFEQKVNVKEALAWARTAVDKSNRDPAILDTLANLLWITGARKEALETETEALAHAKGAMKQEFAGNIAKWKVELTPSTEGDGAQEAEGDEK